MTVAVTGARGLLGRAVVRDLLANGFAVREINRRAGRVGETSTEVIADLRDGDAAREALAGCDMLVHLAALPNPQAGTPKAVFDDNVAVASNVLFAAAQLGIYRVVYSSSQSVLGLPYAETVIPPDYVPVDEAHPCRPADHYSVSKLAGEELAAMLARRGELDVWCLRYPVIWEHERFDACIARRMNVPEQGAKSLWAYIDARDAGRAVRLALARPANPFKIVNVTAVKAFAPEPVPDLVRRWYPGLTDIRMPLQNDSAIFAWQRAESEFGFRARYAWSPTGITDLG